MFKSGFISIIGRPNVGKSTFLNNVLKQKVAIMSNKPQTTRNKILGIYTEEDYQIVFMDTPGIHKPKSKLGNYMVDVAVNALREGVDVLLFLVEPETYIGEGDKYIIDQLNGVKSPVILVINKIDKITKPDILKVIDAYSKLHDFDAVIPISALKGENVDYLLNEVVSRLQEGPKYFPEDMVTDQPERQIVSEIIREKILQLLDEEIPHGTAVEIELMRKREDKDIVDIQATIMCEKKNHKGIIIGKNGSKLKEIGRRARIDIENLLGSKVYIELWVKVKEGWRDSDFLLKNFGYNKKDI